MFRPRFCPHSSCPSRAEAGPAFTWCTCGSYRRKCDGHKVQRYRCTVCRRSFSRQTFRGNYRWRKATLHHQLVPLLASKVSRRQAARILGVNRKTVDRRIARLARISQEFHEAQLEHAARCGGMDGVYQLDEMQTFESHRLLKPVTLAVLIERHSYFVLDIHTAPLPPRRPPRWASVELLARFEHARATRQSGSRAAVRRCMERLQQVATHDTALALQTDGKRTYRSEVQRACWNLRQVKHQTVTNGRAKCDYRNLIFPVNHTLALMRDSLSCLVEGSWANAKKRSAIQRHAQIWLAWRNYVRGVTATTKTTPAMELGILDRPLTPAELIRSRWPLLELGVGSQHAADRATQRAPLHR